MTLNPPMVHLHASTDLLLQTFYNQMFQTFSVLLAPFYPPLDIAAAPVHGIARRAEAAVRSYLDQLDGSHGARSVSAAQTGHTHCRPDEQRPLPQEVHGNDTRRPHLGSGPYGSRFEQTSVRMVVAIQPVVLEKKRNRTRAGEVLP